jgi:hypothetical protein
VADRRLEPVVEAAQRFVVEGEEIAQQIDGDARRREIARGGEESA